MGKWIAVIVVILVVFVGYRFARYGTRRAELAEAADRLLADVGTDTAQAVSAAFVRKAGELGFAVDPAEVEVIVRPYEGKGTIQRMLDGVVQQMVREEVRIRAPVRFVILGPWKKEGRIDVFDVRTTQVRGITSVDRNPELARELGMEPAASPRPQSSVAPETSSPRRPPKGMYGGIKERARRAIAPVGE